MNSIEYLQAKVKELELENNSLKEKKQKGNRTIELKVSYKKCVQINGLRRFPITLYKRELQAILSEPLKSLIENFISEHNGELA